jgi:hypothetical protein
MPSSHRTRARTCRYLPESRFEAPPSSCETAVAYPPVVARWRSGSVYGCFRTGPASASFDRPDTSRNLGIAIADRIPR